MPTKYKINTIGNRLRQVFSALCPGAFLLTAFLIVSAQNLETSLETAVRAENLNNQAVKLADAGKYTEAIELFRQAIVLRPDYAVAYGNLGGTFYRAGRLEEAAAALQKAVELKPDFAEAYSKLGAVYTDLNKYDEAVAALQKAVKFKPDFAMAHYNLGCVFIRQEKFKEAVASLKTAELLNADDSETYVQSGYALSRLKKYAEAIEQLVKAVSLQPTDAEAQFFLGQLYLLGGDKQSALAQYKKIALLDAEAANKLYAVIYGKMLVKVSQK